MSDLNDVEDIDPTETNEWLEAIDGILTHEGPERAEFIIASLLRETMRSGHNITFPMTSDYINTIRREDEDRHPGDPELEKRILALVRWNAMAMVVKAGRKNLELGGHIGTFSSSALLYDIGFNHFWHAPTDDHPGDLVYIQGHNAPGIYARSFVEGRLSETQLENFRQEVGGEGLSSYPHPWLMKDYWQFPTVSMGLGPIQAIYQARFMRYLEARGHSDTSKGRVWCFCGDGEMDEPESLGALTLAGREHLDNLTFVVNCNLQRLDGPVRGNGKIVQELEAIFRGAGWNVIKVMWGRHWDPLLAKDKTGLLKKRMLEVIDGEYQNCKAKGGAYTREHFFGKYPELKAMVENLSDDDIWRLNRGGHDPFKVYAAYSAATKHKGQPTVILVKTVKGYGLGSAGEAMNTAHNTKKLASDQIRAFRDRFAIPIPDDKLDDLPFYRPAPDSVEAKYLKQCREKLGGDLPARRHESTPIQAPSLEVFKAQLESSGDREISTTMAFVRILTTLVKDKTFGKQIVPIVPDEARTFGMEGLFRQLGIYSSVGQLYEPVDSDQVMFYKESKKGQVLQEGINEAGSFCSWISAATSYSMHGVPMIPFYIFYSMFGFQRIGDLAWGAGDSRARGFLLGGTSGRTTLNGEGLQHEDGHSHILAGTIPNCVTYDPTFAYELAVIIQDGMRRMYQENEDVFYYITVMNENYQQPAMPAGAEEGIRQGLYRFSEGSKGKHKVQLLGSGTILREVIEAQKLLEDYDVSADVWSMTSANNLRRDGIETARWNMLHPEEQPKQSYVETCLAPTEGPIIASTDYMKVYSDQLHPYMPRRFVALGTDGFGRSDSRAVLRSFFEVDRYYVAVAALKALADEGTIKPSVVTKAMKAFNIDPEKPNPLTV